MKLSNRELFTVQMSCKRNSTNHRIRLLLCFSGVKNDKTEERDNNVQILEKVDSKLRSICALILLLFLI